ncbi:hypothetical protein GLAREA_05208 [Glarea lozoyensis ATCC 20868]|uniref:Xylanolytic transcriptional activator regulatory domain-containing protein n=1 Tax=Glarea lozoyensis (strain ATCC 20868 / MF5171) TaxID=1116229 RepID=S3DDR0_GLAL2|nr:uncharacterized protein GLAREA_05208 [Glarea lozoyensis ATCC 20868]EPE35870.1 hypothetical protein GLAREA_05208 [Glarea lozoyensis ATCC 20868]
MSVSGSEEEGCAAEFAARVEKQFVGGVTENLGTSEGDNGSEGIEFGDWEDVEIDWNLLDNSQFSPIEYAGRKITHWLSQDSLELQPFNIIQRQADDPVPPPHVQQDLYQIYFRQVHPFAPMFDELRFYKAIERTPDHPPLIALRYSIWALAANTTVEHRALAPTLYDLARKHADDLETKGRGEYVLSLASAQCWYLIASYEASNVFYIKGWMSVGKCVRIVQMLGLHQLDVNGGASQNQNWVEAEEGRRTFWASHLADRFASTLSKRPFIFQDVDRSFDDDKEEAGISLDQVTATQSLQGLSPYAATAVVSVIFGRSLQQILSRKRVGASDVQNGDYWKIHRYLDNWISHIFMTLPPQLDVCRGIQDATVLFLHIKLHTAIVVLHQSAIEIAGSHFLDPNIRNKSFRRCLVSAQEVKNIISSIPDMRSFPIDMWAGYCLQSAASVFIQDMTSYNVSSNSPENLRAVMVALKTFGMRHTMCSWFLEKVELDISQARVGQLKIQDSRTLESFAQFAPLDI